MLPQRNRTGRTSDNSDSDDLELGVLGGAAPRSAATVVAVNGAYKASVATGSAVVEEPDEDQHLLSSTTVSKKRYRNHHRLSSPDRPSRGSWRRRRPW